MPPELALDAMRQADDFGTLAFMPVFALLAIVGYRYLAIFEKFYRFMPFLRDTQPRIGGKSPLQLAGYDVASVPITTLCAGPSIIWSTPTGDLVRAPNPRRSRHPRASKLATR